MFEEEAKKFEGFVDNQVSFYDTRRLEINYFKYVFIPKHSEFSSKEIWAVRTSEQPYDWYFFITSPRCERVLECVGVFYSPRNEGEVMHTRKELMNFSIDYIKSFS